MKAITVMASSVRRVMPASVMGPILSSKKPTWRGSDVLSVVRVGGVGGVREHWRSRCVDQRASAL